MRRISPAPSAGAVAWLLLLSIATTPPLLAQRGAGGNTRVPGRMPPSAASRGSWTSGAETAANGRIDFELSSVRKLEYRFVANKNGVIYVDASWSGSPLRFRLDGPSVQPIEVSGARRARLRHRVSDNDRARGGVWSLSIVPAIANGQARGSFQLTAPAGQSADLELEYHNFIERQKVDRNAALESAIRDLVRRGREATPSAELTIASLRCPILSSGEAILQPRTRFDGFNCSSQSVDGDDLFLFGMVHSGGMFAATHGDEIYFPNLELAGGWKVKSIELAVIPSREGEAGATILDANLDGVTPKARIRWWTTPEDWVLYLLLYVLEGPQGTSPELAAIGGQ